MAAGMRRLAAGGLFLSAAVVAVLFAGIAGAATAAEPDPVPPISGAAPVPDDPSDAASPPRRFVAMGSVVLVRADRVAVMVPSRDKPILVAIRPITTVRLNTKKSDLSQLQRGDRVVVVGRPGPRGNM